VSLGCGYGTSCAQHSISSVFGQRPCKSTSLITASLHLDVCALDEWP